VVYLVIVNDSISDSNVRHLLSEFTEFHAKKEKVPCSFEKPVFFFGLGY
jgi:hypothetical protein